MKKNITIMCQNTVFQRAIGYSLSLKLDMIFVDVNAILEYENTDLEELIALNGKEYYDKVEKKAIAAVADYNNTVIVTDRYGIFASGNLDKLRETSVMLLLDMNKLTFEKLNEIYSSNDIDDNFLKHCIFEEQKQFFLEKADVIINIDGLSETEVVEACVKALKDYFKE